MTDENSVTVEDGFGSIWSCHNDQRTSRPCGLEVVRPGKVQCWCDSQREDGSCLHSRSEHSSKGSFCRSYCKRELCMACMGRGEGIVTDDPTGWGTCSDCDGTGFPP